MTGSSLYVRSDGELVLVRNTPVEYRGVSHWIVESNEGVCLKRVGSFPELIGFELLEMSL